MNDLEKIALKETLAKLDEDEVGDFLELFVKYLASQGYVNNRTEEQYYIFSNKKDGEVIREFLEEIKQP